MHDGPAKRELSASPPPSPQLTRQRISWSLRNNARTGALKSMRRSSLSPIAAGSALLKPAECAPLARPAAPFTRNYFVRAKADRNGVADGPGRTVLLTELASRPSARLSWLCSWAAAT